MKKYISHHNPSDMAQLPSYLENILEYVSTNDRPLSQNFQSNTTLNNLSPSKRRRLNNSSNKVSGFSSSNPSSNPLPNSLPNSYEPKLPPNNGIPPSKVARKTPLSSLLDKLDIQLKKTPLINDEIYRLFQEIDRNRKGASTTDLERSLELISCFLDEKAPGLTSARGRKSTKITKEIQPDIPEIENIKKLHALIKNQISAKDCRKRKAINIEELEQKVVLFEESNRSNKQIIKALQSQIKALKKVIQSIENP